MMQLRSYFTWICCLILIGFTGKAQAQDAQAILDKAAQMYEQSNGIKANFAIHSVVPQQNISESFEGIIEMKGDKFKLETPDMITWYDGQTQWVYVMRNEEVNVSTPSGDELQLTNPAVLLRQYKKGFSVQYKGTSTTRQAKSAYDITLIPKKKSDIQQIDLQIEKMSNIPAAITITDKNKATVSIYISKWETGKNQADSFFSFNESDYPDAEIIDLR
ncbi:LolA-like putative outer membrane lipoprotein chaperone [Parabacteroides sp. AD58]|uniref:LolA-like putative outer membrane lipoprotein chaperone n=1 Tax=Parabacteroides absconsus TaxID=2951805 RepID=A0ABZ2IJX7_9BACT|nr:LolA-like putative outer membrane lipoprotein chaperone [Parabacteroides sp. AD58]MCM6900644.1 outer-membrane lipoprotein carrier protein LolA [Parabacteroides sp. AD58]